MESLKEIHLYPPERGWMTCAFLADSQLCEFIISHTPVDFLWQLARLAQSVVNGRLSEPAVALLEPDWLVVSYNPDQQVLSLLHKSPNKLEIFQSYTFTVSADELAYRIGMACEKLLRECGGQPAKEHWHHEIPKF